MRQYRTRTQAFTIVELIVVISVIGILAAIGIVSYSGWRNSTIANQLKSDLNGAATAMENSRTFNNVYPATVPTTFTPSTNITLTGGSSDGKTYCIDATSSQNTTILYYVDQNGGSQGAQAGTCATRPVPPSAPSNLITTTSSDTSVNLSWSAGIGAVNYLAQCATDTGYTTNLTQATPTGLTSPMTGLTPGTLYYCRVQAVNGTGSSAWTANATTTTTDIYDSFAVATSISGYWSTPPDGFLLEDGSAVSRTTYADLFAAIGTTYGAGNGSSTFNLPDSRGMVAVNQNSADAEFTTIGQKYGEKTHLWTVAELPSHTHPINFDEIGARSSYTDTTDSGSLTFGSGDDRVSVTYWGMHGTYSHGQGQAAGVSQPYNIIQPSIVKSFAIKYSLPTSASSILPAATSLQGYWSTAPDGYLLEDGSAVSRTTYADLFAAIGTTYGAGDGSTTFNLPDSRGRTSVNFSPADTEFNTMGKKYGEKTHTMTIAEMPSHAHPVNFGEIGARSSYSDTTDGGSLTFGSGDDRVTVTYWGMHGSYSQGQGQAAGGGQPSNVIQPSITKLFAIKYRAPTTTVSTLAPATSLEGWWPTVPTGYLAEDGSAVSRSTYAALFAVLGTTYGVGDGSTTFNLPDSRGRVAVNQNPADVEFKTIGQKYGEKTHQLTVAEMPSHAHPVDFDEIGARSSYSDTTDSGGLTFGANDDRVAVTYWGMHGTYHQGQGQAAGGNQPHNVIQPSITKLFVIKY